MCFSWRALGIENGRVSSENYDAAIGDVRAFLSADSLTVQQRFSERMQAVGDARLAEALSFRAGRRIDLRRPMRGAECLYHRFYPEG